MPTVLVVDDNATIVDVLAEYLRAAGYTAVTAADGPAALEAARVHRPDLALVDVMLPGIDGLELTRRFQADDIPVILVTARTEEVDRLVGLEIGADDYITKPFSPREVVARVKAVLRRCERRAGAAAGGGAGGGPGVGSGAGGGTVLTVGGLVVDPERREVLIDGEVVDVTRSEFDLLATMAAQPGRVFTRLQLLEAASGDAFEGYERTIDAHVKNLRRKLGDDPKSPRFIRTVIGVGYKVEDRP
jgi:two-component system alkaline phosphatase synthesis response regulator PhoP